MNTGYYISKKGAEIPIEKVKVLITVKTYPLPSKEYQELVCTAGIKEDGSWIRLYPIPFRHLPWAQQYKKWDWIEVGVVKHDGDNRNESHRPCGDIKVIGNIDTAKNWQERQTTPQNAHICIHRTYALWGVRSYDNRRRKN